MTKSASIVAVVNAALAALIAFGVDLSAEQQVALVGVVNAVLILIAAWRDPDVPFGNAE